MVVVDASLAVKWLVPEDDSEQALGFLRSFGGEVKAPDLLLIEVGNTLVRLTNEKKLNRQEATDRLERLSRYCGTAVHLHRITENLTALAMNIATALGHPIKDCVYLALADQLGCPLATCDVKFRDRVADPARVKLLTELV